MEPTKLQKVIAKIQALRNISESTHSKAEKETCLGLVAKLIAEHALSEAELIQNPGSVGEPIDLDSESIIYESKRMTAWLGELAVGLAKLNGLFIFNAVVRNADTHRKANRYRVIGRRSDIELALYMMSYLTKLIEDLSWDYVPKSGDAKRGVNPERESWRLGCTRGYLDKMKAERDAVNKSGTSAALVFIGNKVLEAKQAFIAKTGMHLSKGTYHSKASHNDDTFNSGYRKGQSLTVADGLNGGNSQPNKLFDR